MLRYSIFSMLMIAAALAALFALAGCDVGPKSRNIGNGVFKTCDAGHAVYVARGRSVAVVPNAPECRK